VGFKARRILSREPLRGKGKKNSRDRQRSRRAGLTGQRSPDDVVPTPLPNDILDRSIMAAASTSVKGTNVDVAVVRPAEAWQIFLMSVYEPLG